jgi:hypothetical protein
MNCGTFRYLGKTLNIEKCMGEFIKGKLTSGNVRFSSVHNPLSSLLMSKDVRLK